MRSCRDRVDGYRKKQPGQGLDGDDNGKTETRLTQSVQQQQGAAVFSEAAGLTPEPGLGPVYYYAKRHVSHHTYEKTNAIFLVAYGNRLTVNGD